jgi:asparagine synthase (glutamine-hydrolysing)
MCGIAGIWNIDGKPVEYDSISRFTDSLAHRGPDGRGIWKDDKAGIALGHRRLSILDLSENASQPMMYADGRLVISYNGEIYNFIEIKNTLLKMGYLFRTESDTEVLLAAYLAWGPDMLLKLNGMWAFAIYDSRDRSLFFSRDRFGIKPFLYRFTGKTFSFASEMKAFKYLDGYIPNIDRDSAKRLLINAFELEGSTRTMLHSVNRLQSGHYGVLKNGELVIRRWWNTLDHLIEVPSSFNNQTDMFRELFFNSVKLRMRSDVSIGSCLSGGFDSSAIVCALAEIGKRPSEMRTSHDWQETFIATFPGAENDESVQAKKVIDYSGVKGNFFPMRDTNALDNIEKILYDCEDVYISLPTAIWQIYKELRNANTVVSLDGHGADESMGAYKEADFLCFHDAPPILFSPRKNLEIMKQYYSLLNKENKSVLLPMVQSVVLNHPSFNWAKKIIYDVITPELLVTGGKPLLLFDKQIVKENPEFALTAEDDILPKEWGNVNKTLYRMFHSTVLPTILRNFDRLSMAHGIEVRMPFMDWQLVQLLFSLPDSSQIGAGYTKRIARFALKGHMPESIRLSKAKIGFNSPLPEWLSGPLTEWSRDLLYESNMNHHDLINGNNLKSFINKNTINKTWSWQNSTTAWKYLHYLWFENNFFKNTN